MSNLNHARLSSCSLCGVEYVGAGDDAVSWWSLGDYVNWVSSFTSLISVARVLPSQERERILVERARNTDVTFTFSFTLNGLPAQHQSDALTLFLYPWFRDVLKIICQLDGNDIDLPRSARLSKLELELSPSKSVRGMDRRELRTPQSTIGTSDSTKATSWYYVVRASK